MKRIAQAAVLAAALAGVLAPGQALHFNRPDGDGLIHNGSGSSERPVEVRYLYPEQVTVKAGKSTEVELHFRVAPGLHINSHQPLSEFLIPTSFSIPAGAGVRLDGAVYPPGAEVTLPLDPRTKLSVYSGAFQIRARIVAGLGDHLVRARLRYQACDNNVCMPPRTILAAIDVLGN